MRIDFQLDDDGDLKLGTQQVNAEGYLLYYRQPTGEDQKRRSDLTNRRNSACPRLLFGS